MVKLCGKIFIDIKLIAKVFIKRREILLHWYLEFMYVLVIGWNYYS